MVPRSAICSRSATSSIVITCSLNMLSICRSEQDITLPELGKYATGLMFIEAREMDEVQTEFTKMATQIGLEVGFRIRLYWTAPWINSVFA